MQNDFVRKTSSNIKKQNQKRKEGKGVEEKLKKEETKKHLDSYEEFLTQESDGSIDYNSGLWR